MDRDVHDFLVEVYGAAGLPFTTCFGNGDPSARTSWTCSSEVYNAHTMREPWQAGDLLLVDNLRCAHSREAFEGHVRCSWGWPSPCGCRCRCRAGGVCA